MVDLAIFAHFDPQGHVAPHVLRHLQALREVTDRLIVVSTAELTPSARTALQDHAELVERANQGYDFCSWQAGLERAADWPERDRVILANDSVVGPLVPYRTMIDTMVRRRAAFWGTATSLEGEPHLQSFLMCFEGVALRAPVLQAFWRGVTVLPDRRQVIAHYEQGLSRVMRAAGLEAQGYFQPTARDDRVARRRRGGLAEATALRQGAQESGRQPNRRDRARARRIGDTFRRRGGVYNPMIALWDRALDGRLPFVKIETLRDDPYEFGAERMLAACERAQPAALEGVREYLERTRSAYAALGRGTRAVRT